MRVLADIPQPDINALKPVCAKSNISRAEAIRRAVRFYIQQNQPADTKEDKAFGLWKNNPVDGLAYQNKIRSEWET